MGISHLTWGTLLMQGILYKIVSIALCSSHFTTLYKKGIKQIQNKPMETTKISSYLPRIHPVDYTYNTSTKIMVWINRKWNVCVPQGTTPKGTTREIPDHSSSVPRKKIDVKIWIIFKNKGVLFNFSSRGSPNSKKLVGNWRHEKTLVLRILKLRWEETFNKCLVHP